MTYVSKHFARKIKYWKTARISLHNPKNKISRQDLRFHHNHINLTLCFKLCALISSRTITLICILFIRPLPRQQDWCGIWERIMYVNGSQKVQISHNEVRFQLLF